MCALFLVLDLVVSVGVGSLQLRHANDALSDALVALGDDDLTAAVSSLDAARASLRSAGDLSHHPGVALAVLVPGIGDDIRGFRSLIAAATHAADAAGRVTVAFEELGALRSGIAASIYSSGTVDVDSLAVLAAAAERAQSDLAAATSVLGRADRDALIGPLGRAVGRAEHRVAAARDATRRAIALAGLVPTMTGHGSPRRYLLAFQSPSEARGGGGLIGVYGVLSARSGRVSLDEVGPVEDLGPELRRPVDARPAYEALYGPLSGLDDWRQANLSPTFPLTSEVLLDMFERVRSERLDGVIAMDPIALGHIARGLPGLDAPGWDKTITNDNARRMLLFEIYREFVHQERLQNRYLRALIDRLWARVSAGDVEPGGLLGGFAEAAAKQHLKIYSTDPAEQEVLTELGIGGDPRTHEGAVQLVYNNSNSGNKLDFFLRREQSVDVELDGDGGANITTEIVMHNDVPKEGLRAVSRSGVRSGLELGENRMSLHLMLPRGAEPGEFRVDGREVDAYRGRDGGFPVVWQVLTVGPDETTTITVRYRLEDALEPGSEAFRFTLWPQTTARPDVFELRVSAPPGRAFVTRAGEARRVVERSGALKTPESVVLHLSSPVPPA